MKKRKIILCIFFIILIVVISLIVILKVKNYSEIETEGDYTGYQLRLIVNYDYDIYGIAGQNSGSGKYYKNYNIKEGDKLYEPSFGGIWLLNYEFTNEEKNNDDLFTPRIMVEIIELNENGAELYIDEKELNYNYNVKINLDAKIHSGDYNYNYEFKIIKIDE